MGNLGPTELLIILLILVVLFGAKKLPDLARGTGRAMRIFKAETKGLGDDDEQDGDAKDDPTGATRAQITATRIPDSPATPSAQTTQPVQPVQATPPVQNPQTSQPLPPTHTEH